MKVVDWNAEVLTLVLRMHGFVFCGSLVAGQRPFPE